MLEFNELCKTFLGVGKFSTWMAGQTHGNVSGLVHVCDSSLTTGSFVKYAWVSSTLQHGLLKMPALNTQPRQQPQQ